jgi:hypothetical protein
MADVTLVLKANNSDYVNKMREAQSASQKVYDTVEKGSVKSRGLIAQEIQMQKQLTDQRNRATTNASLVQYNKLLDDSKKRLADLEKQGVQSNQNIEKSQSNLLTYVLRTVAAYISFRTVIAGLKETFLAYFTKTQEGMDLLERKTNGVKAALSVLQGEFIRLGKTLTDETANDSGLKKFTNAFEFILGKGLKTFTEITLPGVGKAVTAYFKDVGGRMSDASVAAEKWTATQQELEKLEISMIVPRAKANEQIREARALYAERKGTVEELVGYLKKALDLEKETADKEIAYQHQVMEKIKIINAEKLKVGKLTRADERKLAEAEAKEIDLVTESYGRQFRALNSLRTAREELLKEQRTAMTPGKVKMIDMLGLSEADLEYLKEKLEELDKLQKDYQKRYIDNLHALGKKVTEENKAIDADNKKRQEAEKKDRETTLELLKLGLREVSDFIGKLADIEVQNAQRNRELLDTQISEAQQSLDTEVELYKAGYASNVAAKQKEVENLKKLRENALKEEEKAIRKQRVMEAIAQGINIFTSVTQLLKQYTKIPIIGIALAAAAITAMFALLATFKTRSTAAQYAKGGWTGDGGQRDSTGEKVAGITHEKEFVVRKGPAHKFIDVLEAINKDDRRAVLNSFTKLSPELLGGTSINNITVENNGPNKRLDQIRSELSKFNSTKEEILELPGRTIYKRGNTIRTVRR